MMELFLTSSIGGFCWENGERVPCELDGSNGFLGLIEKFWPKSPRCLVMSSDPENEQMNEDFRRMFAETFKISNLPFSEIEICDIRNESRLGEMLYEYDVLILSGGHVPTQNRFFSRIGLGSLLKTYEGIVIGISAGTMNCAGVVYAQPELEGEAIDPGYSRYLEGLGLTGISVLPHFQELRDMEVDGLRVLEDISLPDSIKRPFYALVDGSYIFIHDGLAVLYGEAYLFEGGKMTRICERDKSINV